MKYDDVEKFVDIVERELDINIADLEGNIQDYIDDYVLELLDELVFVTLSEEEESQFSRYEIKREILNDIVDLLNINVTLLR